MTRESRLQARAAIRLQLLEPEAAQRLLERAEASGRGFLEAAAEAGALDPAACERVRKAVARAQAARPERPDAASRPPAPAALPPGAPAGEKATARRPPRRRPAERSRPAEGAGAAALDLPADAVEGYRLVAPIGQGAMATVYRARDVRLERPVALKVMARKLLEREDVRARFLREARAAARVVHPNIVTIYDTGDAGGLPYIAMELIEGEDLRRRVAREGPLDAPDVLAVAGAMAAALEASHAAGLVHRDLKPENILRADDGRLKLCDLGLARQADSDEGAITNAGVVLGTPHFVSPEQARGAALDVRSDLYSLGATLFYLATGRPPFEGPTAPVVMTKHIQEPPPRPASLRPELPEPLDALILRLLAKEPAARFESPAALREAVEDLRAGRRSAARPERRAPRAAAGAARRRTAQRPKRRRADPLVRLALWLAAGLALLALLSAVKDRLGPPAGLA